MLKMCSFCSQNMPCAASMNNDFRCSTHLNDEVIKITNVSKIFNGRSVLTNATISFYRAQIVGIMGVNGAGKTTFLKIVCGLICPEEGDVLIEGLNVLQRRSHVMEKVGVVFHSTRNLYWRLSGWENYVYFCGLKGLFGEQVGQRGKILFESLGLSDIRNERVENLSSGTKQKVAIVCALCNDPGIVLLDEPTMGLDAVSQKNLEEWIMSSATQQRKTVLIASHDRGMLERLCTRIVTMSDGMMSE